jgi:hypothetical protein
MPGVHSDVGGAYDKRHLGNLALLTMIDRAVARTELSFNLKQARKLQVLPRDGERIRVHDEFDGTWRLWSGAHPRPIDLSIAQSIHPFAKKMTSLPITYKNQVTQDLYRLSPEFSSMNDAEDFLSGHFKGVY